MNKKKIETLESQKSDLNSTIAVYTDFSSSLNALQDLVSGFFSSSMNSLLSSETVSSDPTVVSATVESNTDTGSVSVFVSQLAKRDTVYSDRFKSNSKDLIEMGNQNFEIKIGDGETFKINVDMTDSLTNKDALQLITDEINNAGVEATASIVQDTNTTSRLVIMSDNSGSDFAFSFSTDNKDRVDEESLLSALGITDPSGERNKSSGQNGGYIVEDISELNALLTVNGLEIVRQSNTIDDVINGVTLQIHKIHKQNSALEMIDFKLSQDHIKTEIESFIKSYNEINSFIREKTSIDTSTYTRGELYGDSSLTQLRMQLSSIIFTPLNNSDANGPNILADIGIRIGRNGELSIQDSIAFDNALEDNFQGVVGLFSGEDGISSRIKELLNSFTKTGGIIDSKQKSVKSRITTIDKRMDNEEERLQSREEQLRIEYAKLQQAFYQLESQMSMIQSSQSILDSLYGGSMGIYL